MSIEVPCEIESTALVGSNLAESSGENNGDPLLGGTSKPPRQGPGRVRLPDKTSYSLRDILNIAKGGRADMQQILYWIDRERIDAKGRYDLARLDRLGELSHLVAGLALAVAEIERMAADARLGIYEPPVNGPEGNGNGR